MIWLPSAWNSFENGYEVVLADRGDPAASVGKQDIAESGPDAKRYSRPSHFAKTSFRVFQLGSLAVLCVQGPAIMGIVYPLKVNWSTIEYITYS
ncbi:hypothetical protein CPY51_08410 [Rhizobium tubonense]|uniref:Uncharacterized protein n=1 Tax=Rhizobium tubonense TaxID=484088 RepID=A0A2W4CQQ2_9HYPH|nr:hypothetical protein CPY51_08410 [Rhizobium tubonense]